jgi:hypothetical protein
MPEACAAIVTAGHPKAQPPAMNGNMDAVKEENATLRHRMADLEEKLMQKTAAAAAAEEVQQLRDHDHFMTQLVERLQTELRELQEGAEGILREARAEAEGARSERDAAVSKLRAANEELRRMSQAEEEMAHANRRDRVSAMPRHASVGVGLMGGHC